MTQNIYDDAAFFAGYSQLQRSIHGLDRAPEWPSLRSMLPNVRGSAVVDLGCGFGWFCRWAADQRAESVIGIDISQQMLERARRETPEHLGIDYRLGDLERVELPTGAFDLIFSSLAIHYVVDLDRLFDVIRDAIAPGGAFTCSIEHPIRTAPTDPGFVTDQRGQRVWPLDHYLTEGPRTLNWITEGVVKQHRTISTYVNALIERGLTLTRLEEFRPSDADLEAEPTWNDELHRPSFLLLSATR